MADTLPLNDVSKIKKKIPYKCRLNVRPLILYCLTITMYMYTRVILHAVSYFILNEHALVPLGICLERELSILRKV